MRLKYVAMNGNVLVENWKMMVVRVSSNDILSEAGILRAGISRPGVFFLVDKKQCYFEAEDMSAKLRAIWEQSSEELSQELSTLSGLAEEAGLTGEAGENKSEATVFIQDAEQHNEQPTFSLSAEQELREVVHEAICFISLDKRKELEGKKILHVLGALGFVKLNMSINSAHAEGNESFEGFTLYKGAVVKNSEHSASEYPEAYEKVEWNGSFGVLSEDSIFSSPSGAAEFVSGYKSIDGPGKWMNEEGKKLNWLRKHCIMSERKYPGK